MLLQALLLVAQSYSGPAPAKADLPYLLHAGTLIATEIAEVKEIIPGANSAVKTPLGFPIFIIRVEKLALERLRVFPLDSKDGHRVIDTAQVYALTVTALKNNQYRLEVNDSLPNGEYAITFTGSTQAFCFAVF